MWKANSLEYDELLHLRAVPRHYLQTAVYSCDPLLQIAAVAEHLEHFLLAVDADELRLQNVGQNARAGLLRVRNDVERARHRRAALHGAPQPARRRQAAQDRRQLRGILRQTAMHCGV